MLINGEMINADAPNIDEMRRDVGMCFPLLIILEILRWPRCWCANHQRPNLFGCMTQFGPINADVRQLIRRKITLAGMWNCRIWGMNIM